MRQETPDQVTACLLRVIANAEFQVLPGFHAFEQLPDGPQRTRPDALACVRDHDTWSQLVPRPATQAGAGCFTMFSFHFDERFDATGFVGWLHAHLARTTGAGHIVICGRDRRSAASFDHVRGGIFDYWGCPAERADTVLAEVRSLIERGRAATV
jgi:uncharacterized protein DUF6196